MYGYRLWGSTHDTDVLAAAAARCPLGSCTFMRCDNLHTWYEYVVTRGYIGRYTMITVQPCLQVYYYLYTNIMHS